MYVPQLLADETSLALMLAIDKRHARRLLRSKLLPIVTVLPGVERVRIEDVQTFVDQRVTGAPRGPVDASGEMDVDSVAAAAEGLPVRSQAGYTSSCSHLQPDRTSNPTAGVLRNDTPPRQDG